MTGDVPGAEPGAVADRLVASRDPYLIGVRHHSPSFAAAVPAMLEAFDPTVVLVELPSDLQDQVQWLGASDTVAPIALSATTSDGEVYFYPFADFSPELAAIRWAFARGIAVVACDLPVSMRNQPTIGEAESPGLPTPSGSNPSGLSGSVSAKVAPTLTDRLLNYGDGDRAADSFDELWDRLVEAPAPGESAERLRRAGLAVGWALRVDAASSAGHSNDESCRREAWMRERIAEARDQRNRVAVVVGAFHAAALVEQGVGDDPIPRAEGVHGDTYSSGPPPHADAIVTACTPFSFPLLDSRSGYPAGIRDPEWQQAVFEAGGDPQRIEDAAARCITSVAVELRRAGHAAGTPDACEAVRLALDLARLRDLPSPGRLEVIEALQTTMTQGEPLGRGRAVAAAIEPVLVGTRRGMVSRSAPESGLVVHVRSLLNELRLPGPTSSGKDTPTEVRLDPLRSPLDRRREIAFQRLRRCGIPYATPIDSAGIGGDETLTRRWTLQWKVVTEPIINAAGIRGVTLEQVVASTLRTALNNEHSTADLLEILSDAAACRISAVVADALAIVASSFVASAPLADLVRAWILIERLARGHEPGWAPDPQQQHWLENELAPALVLAAIREVGGTAGSERDIDAVALFSLVVRLRDETYAHIGSTRLHAELRHLLSDGHPLMQGAAAASLVALHVDESGPDDAAELSLGIVMASWIDGDREQLRFRIRGVALTGLAMIESAPELLGPLVERVGDLDDVSFSSALPSLRGGFSVLAVAARARFADIVAHHLGVDRMTAGDLDLKFAAEDLAAWALADGVGSRTVAQRRASAFQISTPADIVEAIPGGATGGSIRVGWNHDAEQDAGEGASVGVAVGPEAGAVAASLEAGAEAEARTSGAAEETHTDGQAGAPGRNRDETFRRWCLVLGQRRAATTPLDARQAQALDRLYGHGSGEGSRSDVGQSGRGHTGTRGGNEQSIPTAREWSDELCDLFGERVREEVLGLAAANGDLDAMRALDLDRVTPSIDLLQQMLALRGALPPDKTNQLRRMVQRVVDELVRDLAVRLRPALTGAVTQRSTRRASGPLDLRRTVERNLRHAEIGVDGKITLAPRQLWFRTRVRRSFDWRIVMVVDVSGSMERSVIYAALVGAIFAALPAVHTNFLAFSTSVIDLSDHIDDPLGLLLEVSVGGGTDIAGGLRYARQVMTVPSRTIVVLLSDFEEGGPIGALLSEVRALSGSGATLLGLAALDDGGQPRYAKAIAEQVVAAGMPVAALSPLELARWVGERLR